MIKAGGSFLHQAPSSTATPALPTPRPSFGRQQEELEPPTEVPATVGASVPNAGVVKNLARELDVVRVPQDAEQEFSPPGDVAQTQASEETETLRRQLQEMQGERKSSPRGRQALRRPLGLPEVHSIETSVAAAGASGSSSIAASARADGFTNGFGGSSSSTSSACVATAVGKGKEAAERGIASQELVSLQQQLAEAWEEIRHLREAQASEQALFLEQARAKDQAAEEAARQAEKRVASAEERLAVGSSQAAFAEASAIRAVTEEARNAQAVSRQHELRHMRLHEEEQQLALRFATLEADAAKMRQRQHEEDERKAHELRRHLELEKQASEHAKAASEELLEMQQQHADEVRRRSQEEKQATAERVANVTNELHQMRQVHAEGMSRLEASHQNADRILKEELATSTLQENDAVARLQSADLEYQEVTNKYASELRSTVEKEKQASAYAMRADAELRDLQQAHAEQLRLSVEEERQSTAQRLANISSEVNQMRRNNDEELLKLESRRREEERQLKEELATKAIEEQQEVSSHVMRTDAKLRELQQNHDDLLRRSVEQGRQSAAERIANMSSELQQLTSDHEEELCRLEAARQEDETKFKEELATKTMKETQSAAERIAHMNSEINDLRRRHEDELLKLQARSCEEEEQIKEEFGAKTTQERQSAAERIANMSSELQQLRIDREEELLELATARREDERKFKAELATKTMQETQSVAERIASMSSEIHELKRMHEEELLKLEARSRQEEERLKEEFGTQTMQERQLATQRIASMSFELHELRRSHEEELSRSKAAWREEERQLKEELATKTLKEQEAAERFARAGSELRDAERKQTAELERSLQELATAACDTRAQFTAELDELHQRHGVQLVQLETRWQEAEHDLHEQLAAELAQEKRAIARAMRSETALTEARQRHVEDLKRALDEENKVAARVARMASELQEYRTLHADNLLKMEDQDGQASAIEVRSGEEFHELRQMHAEEVRIIAAEENDAAAAVVLLEGELREMKQGWADELLEISASEKDAVAAVSLLEGELKQLQDGWTGEMQSAAAAEKDALAAVALLQGELREMQDGWTDELQSAAAAEQSTASGRIAALEIDLQQLRERRAEDLRAEEQSCREQIAASAALELNVARSALSARDVAEQACADEAAAYRHEQLCLRLLQEEEQELASSIELMEADLARLQDGCKEDLRLREEIVHQAELARQAEVAAISSERALEISQQAEAAAQSEESQCVQFLRAEQESVATRADHMAIELTQLRQRHANELRRAEELWQQADTAKRAADAVAAEEQEELRIVQRRCVEEQRAADERVSTEKKIAEEIGCHARGAADCAVEYRAEVAARDVEIETLRRYRETLETVLAQQTCQSTDNTEEQTFHAELLAKDAALELQKAEFAATASAVDLLQAELQHARESAQAASSSIDAQQVLQRTIASKDAELHEEAQHMHAAIANAEQLDHLRQEHADVARELGALRYAREAESRLEAEVEFRESELDEFKRHMQTYRRPTDVFELEEWTQFGRTFAAQASIQEQEMEALMQRHSEEEQLRLRLEEQAAELERLRQSTQSTALSPTDRERAMRQELLLEQQAVQNVKDLEREARLLEQQVAQRLAQEEFAVEEMHGWSQVERQAAIKASQERIDATGTYTREVREVKRLENEAIKQAGLEEIRVIEIKEMHAAQMESALVNIRAQAAEIAALREEQGRAGHELGSQPGSKERSLTSAGEEAKLLVQQQWRIEALESELLDATKHTANSRIAAQEEDPCEPLRYKDQVETEEEQTSTLEGQNADAANSEACDLETDRRLQNDLLWPTRESQQGAVEMISEDAKPQDNRHTTIVDQIGGSVFGGVTRKPVAGDLLGGPQSSQSQSSAPISTPTSALASALRLESPRKSALAGNSGAADNLAPAQKRRATVTFAPEPDVASEHVPSRRLSAAFPLVAGPGGSSDHTGPPEPLHPEVASAIPSRTQHALGSVIAGCDYVREHDDDLDVALEQEMRGLMPGCLKGNLLRRDPKSKAKAGMVKYLCGSKTFMMKLNGDGHVTVRVGTSWIPLADWIEGLDDARDSAADLEDSELLAQQPTPYDEHR